MSSNNISTSIVVDFHERPTSKVELHRSHYQIFQNLYLKNGEGKTKTHGRENTFIKRNNATTILVTYSFILVRTQSSLIIK